MKIFISIAGYRDPLLYNTISEAYKTAKHKESLVFGVVDQSYAWESLDLESFSFRNQIRYFRVDPYYARGVCWARSVAQSLSSTEDYFFQIDSHTLFDQDWDELLLDYYHKLKQYHSKPIITAYPHCFQAVDNNILDLKKERYEGLLTLVADENNSFIHNNDYENFYVGAIPHIISGSDPVHGYLASANFFFSSMSIVEEIPYDPFLFFSGEEHSLALRCWTNGYNLFHIPEMPIYHYYGRDYRTTIWQDEEIDKNKTQKWWELDLLSKNRLGEIVRGKTGTYGCGPERTLNDYINWTGIDYFSRTLLPKAKTGEEIFSVDYREKIIPDLK